MLKGNRKKQFLKKVGWGATYEKPIHFMLTAVFLV
jgi:hypothetical protein